MIKRLILVAVAVLVLGAASVGGWRMLGPIEVTVLAPQAEVPVTIYGLGNVDAERISKAGFDVSGLMAEMRVRVGDRVTTGQLIARLDTRRQELRVAAAADALAVAEATVTQREARVGSAAANVKLKRQQRERARELENRGAGPAASARDAEVALDVAIADMVESQRALDVSVVSIKQARTALAQERDELDHHLLKAPFDGFVTERLAVEGAVVQAGQAVVGLAATDSLRIVAFINEAQAGRLAPGQPATVRLRSRAGETFAAKVDRIDPASDQVTEERRVSLVFDTLPTPLYLAEQAESRILVGVVRNALLVPERAVRHRDAGTGVVWTVVDGRLTERRVAFGQRLEDGRIEIVTQLPDGVSVLADRLPGAHADASVRIVERPTGSAPR